MELTFDELFFLRDAARMEIFKAQNDLKDWEEFTPVECGPSSITTEDILQSIQYHKNRIRTAEVCVQKLTQMMKEA